MENETSKPEEDKILHWENIIKAWILSLIGLALLSVDIYDILSTSFNIPIMNIPFVEDKYDEASQKFLLFIGSMILFFAPRTFEKKCEDWINGFKK